MSLTTVIWTEGRGISGAEGCGTSPAEGCGSTSLYPPSGPMGEGIQKDAKDLWRGNCEREAEREKHFSTFCSNSGDLARRKFFYRNTKLKKCTLSGQLRSHSTAYFRIFLNNTRLYEIY